MTQAQHIMFVGVGAIGMPMAVHMTQSGLDVTAVDPSETQRKTAEAAGIPARSSTRDAHEADAVIVMVATPDQLAEVVLGDSESQPGLLTQMRSGADLIIMSTVGPESVEGLAEAAAEHGVGLTDAPVTGGIARAANGTLRLFVSGESSARIRVQPILDTLGSTIDCGEAPGKGQAYKAVNQLLCAVHIVAGAEALSLAEKLDLDPAHVMEAVSGGAAASFMLSDRGPRMLEGPDAKVASAVGIFVKDTALVHDIAAAAGHQGPLLDAAQQKFTDAAQAGFLHADDSQVIQTYRS